MAVEKSKSIARGKGVTNCTPGSVVQCTAKSGVNLTFRWFPADSTALLEGKTPRHDSKALTALPFIVGALIGDKFEALDPDNPKALRLPAPVKQVGRLEKGCFVPAEASIQAKYQELAAYIDKFTNKPPADEAGKKKLEALSTLNTQGWRDVAMHRITLFHLQPETLLGVCIAVDSKRRFRRHPLWQIKAGDNDIVLDIFETYGQHALDDKALKVETRNEGSTGKPHLVDHLTARLTGNIWLRSTHPFNAADVDALNVEQTTPAMKMALKKIYAAQFENQGANFVLDIPQDEQGTAKVRFLWEASANSNCKDNIGGADLKTDIPSRVHPAAYAAAARAAFAAKVTQIDFSSSWRPMLGSMGHRTGLALDMNWLRGEKDVSLNRKGLGDSQATGTISQEEQEAYREMQAAAKALADAEKSKDAARIKTALGTDIKAKDAWQRAVAKNQPAMLDTFRKNLLDAKPLVTQVLDPWYMERNTRDEIAPTPNEQKDALEKLHKNHLHITIDDPELP